MRRALVLSMLVALPACGDASTTNAGVKGIGDDPSARGTDAGQSADAPSGASPADGSDEDGDGVPNDLDCDPRSPDLGERVIEDDLSADRGLFTVADGFPASSWTYDAAAYQQTRLLDASDAALYLPETDLGNVQIDVRTSSTEVGDITPRLRQIFVLVGATSASGSLDAHGCGIEIADPAVPATKTSIVALAGPTAEVETTALERVTRPQVAVGEELSIRLRLEDGAMTCVVTQGDPPTVTTATANGLGPAAGRIGLFTRQTKALFRRLRVCKLP